jgi:hypothetical protein
MFGTEICSHTSTRKAGCISRLIHLWPGCEMASLIPPKSMCQSKQFDFHTIYEISGILPITNIFNRYANAIETFITILFLVLYTVVINDERSHVPTVLEWVMYIFVLGDVLDDIRDVSKPLCFWQIIHQVR